MTLRVGVEPVDQPEVRQLLSALDHLLNELYPPEANFLDLDPDEVGESRGVFLVARQDDLAVGCGAARRLSDTTAEIKRMFVAPQARRQGVAQRILEGLEAWAISAGVSRLVLETGDAQPEAIQLYGRMGFVAVPCFDRYAGAPRSVCYEKPLPGSYSAGVGGVTP